MTYRFETIWNALVFTHVRGLFALVLVVFVVFTSNSSYSASGNVTFSGYVRPNTNSATTFFPEPIYSFSNKVALPIFPTGSKSTSNADIRVYMGNSNLKNARKQVQFDTISFKSTSAVRQQAVVVEMTSDKQVVFVCYGKSQSIRRGCVQFNAVKVN